MWRDVDYCCENMLVCITSIALANNVILEHNRWHIEVGTYEEVVDKVPKQILVRCLPVWYHSEV